MSQTIMSSVEKCARCGQTHDDLVFERLGKPIELLQIPMGFRFVLTHWVSCPVTNEPILMRWTDG